MSKETNPFYEEEIKRIKTLRNYYRKNFINGESDESFLTWIEGRLEEMSESKEEPIKWTARNAIT